MSAKRISEEAITSCEVEKGDEINSTKGIAVTHRERLRWLADFGWTMDAKMGVVPVKDIPGRWCWLDGPDNKTVYLRESDGTGILLGGPRDVLTWEQLQDWVTGKPAEVKKPLAGQRSLFGDE